MAPRAQGRRPKLTQPGRVAALLGATALLLWLASSQPRDPDAEFHVPFCDEERREGARPRCGEPSDVPTPRTRFSARSKAQLDEWHAFHDVLRRFAEHAADTPPGNNDSEGIPDRGVVDVLFLGDSITEAMRGTSYGRLSSRAAGIPAVMSSELFRGRGAPPEYEQGGPLRGLCLGISGDQTQHLLWRLEHGELPPTLRPRVVVVLIGTNNLGAGMDEAQTSDGVLAVVDLLRRRRPATTVLLQALLPRGKRPSRTPDPAISAVNKILERGAAARCVDELECVHWLDCGHVFEVHVEAPRKGDGDGADGGNDGVGVPAMMGGITKHAAVVELNQRLMPDLLHPNAEGTKAWAQCMRPVIRRLVAASQDRWPLGVGMQRTQD